MALEKCSTAQHISLTWSKERVKTTDPAPLYRGGSIESLAAGSRFEHLLTGYP